MKRFIKIIMPSALFSLLTILIACAQIEVLPSPDNFRDDADWFFIGMKPDEVKILEIRAKDLPELEKEDMGKFQKLETVVISFTEDPKAPNEKKQAVIDMVRKNLDYLSELKKCPSLKNIALQVGEMLFIREAEKYKEDEAVKENLKRAGDAFAAKIKSILPDVQIYAHNWGW